MDTILVEADGPVTVLTLNRPERFNALTGAMFLRLRDVLRAVGDDPDCRAVVVNGAGRAFCAGLDLDEGLGSDVREAGRWMRIGASAIRLLRDIPQPVVTAVQGHAVGAGFAIAAASDIRVAAPTAVFSAPFVQLGMSAGDLGLSWLLPRQIGSAQAAHLFLTGGRFDAERALALGFVSGVHEDPLAEAMSVARQIASVPEAGVRETKALLNASIAGDGFAAHLELELRTQVLLAFSGDLDQARAEFARRARPHTPPPSPISEES